MPVPAMHFSRNERGVARLRGERQVALCFKSPGPGIVPCRFWENRADVRPTLTDSDRPLQQLPRPCYSLGAFARLHLPATDNDRFGLATRTNVRKPLNQNQASID